MRKVFFAMIVAMFAAPLWANVIITATDLGDGVVAIDYNNVESEQLVRAFALDIKVNNGVITNISDYVIGDENYGYGIFPANFSRYITVLETGLVESWEDPNYTPVADCNDPGALGGLDTNGITIEMGSLYKTAAPLQAGRLCKVTCSESCLLNVTTNATRGNVVPCYYRLDLYRFTSGRMGSRRETRLLAVKHKSKAMSRRRRRSR